MLTRSGTILGGTNALATHHHTVKVNTPKCTEFFFYMQNVYFITLEETITEETAYCGDTCELEH